MDEERKAALQDLESAIRDLSAILKEIAADRQYCFPGSGRRFGRTDAATDRCKRKRTCTRFSARRAQRKKSPMVG